MANTEPPGNLNSARETARLFGVKAVRTINRWIAEGKFPEADLISNGRRYWYDRTLRRHTRRLISERPVTTTETSPTA